MRPVQGLVRTLLVALLPLVALMPYAVHAQPAVPLAPPTIPFVPVDNVPDPDDDYLLMLVPLLISPNCQVPASPQFSNGQPLYAGQVITLSVFCSHAPPNYVWRLNGVVIANATTATITFTVPAGMTSAVFTVTVNGSVPYRAGITRAISILAAPNQSITFGVLPSRLLSDPPFNVVATASSGLPVTFSTTTPAFCSVNGVSVTLNAIGTCTILASQAGNATMTAAVPMSRSFEVEPEIYYVHADHLGTPRAITRPSDNTVVWRWENSDPFGANAPNEDPSNTGTAFKYNLRFPGQYYDQETGTHYNYFRDYDPSTGRYVQSDPLGLMDGVNTFAYVRNSPLMYVDPTGLACTLRQRVFLQLAVNASCKWSGTRRCDDSDSCVMNSVKISLNSACVAARRTINQKCFNGGDAGHREAEQDAINAGKRCLEKRSKCCKGDGAGND